MGKKNKTAPEHYIYDFDYSQLIYRCIASGVLDCCGNAVLSHSNDLHITKEDK